MLKDSTQGEKAALWEQEQTPVSAGLCCPHGAGAAWQAQGALIPWWIQQELSTAGSRHWHADTALSRKGLGKLSQEGVT